MNEMNNPVKLRTLDLFEQIDAPELPTQCRNHSKQLLPFDVAKFIKESEAPYFQSSHGALFDGDCMEFLKRVKPGVVDTVFADPPFNLDKRYGSKSNDNLPDVKYLEWCKAWLDECVRVLKPGGSLFVYNLPRWNIVLGAYLMELGMMFRHDITVEVKSTLPIPGRLYPAHYSLLYFTKGKP
ncbi:DNA-methyltransferase, partial [Rhizobium puerariae]